jgi:hypothetical protein
MLAVNQAIIQLSVHFESWMIAIMTWLKVTNDESAGFDCDKRNTSVVICNTGSL